MSIHKLSIIAFVTLAVLVTFLTGPKMTSATVYFKAGFETGNVDEWIGDEGGNQTGGSYVTTEKPHSGQYSWKAYNDPNLAPPDNISAKLLRWRLDYLQAYYSAWYFWPSNYLVGGTGGQYINFFQWKENAPPYDPTWIVAVKNSTTYPGEDEIIVHDYYGNRFFYTSVRLPKGVWFHLEAFLKTGRSDGQLTVWLNGQQIFALININTSGNPSNTTGYLMWGVGNFGDAGIGKFIYVDDVVVSDVKTYNLTPPSQPRSLSILPR